MLIGQTVIATTGTGAKYYSPWFPRQGDAFVAVFEVLRASDSANTSLSCVVQTKNNEDTDAAPDSVATISTISTTTGATTQQLCTGCKELVRYKFTATGTSSARWLHFRAMPPMWQHN